MKYHVFACDYDDAGMSAYAGYGDLEFAADVLRRDPDVGGQLVIITEDGSLKQVAFSTSHYESVSPNERFRVVEWIFDDGTAVEACRIHQIRKPSSPPSLIGTMPDGTLVAFGGTMHMPNADYHATGAMPSGWVEDPL